MPNEKLTHFNPLGPIAIVERDKAKPPEKPKPQAKPVASTVKPIAQPQTAPRPAARWGAPDFRLGEGLLDADLKQKRDAVQNAWNTILSGKGDFDNARNTFNALMHGADNPFSGAGGNVAEIMGNYIDAVYKLRQAQRMLEQTNAPAIAGIGGALDELCAIWTPSTRT